jgi:hypothetical protein
VEQALELVSCTCWIAEDSPCIRSILFALFLLLQMRVSLSKHLEYVSSYSVSHSIIPIRHYMVFTPLPFLRSTEHGHVAYDCEQNEEIMFTLGIFSLPADKPMQSELASHIGLKGNHFCRRCSVGGTQQEKSSEEGFHSLFSV